MGCESEYQIGSNQSFKQKRMVAFLSEKSTAQRSAADPEGGKGVYQFTCLRGHKRSSERVSKKRSSERRGCYDQLAYGYVA